MCKKEYAVCILLGVLVSLTAIRPAQAVEGADPNTPVAAEPSDSAAAAPSEAADVNSIDSATEAAEPEMFDSNWPEDFNVENVKIVLNFRDALVSDVLDYLSTEAGLIIMSDAPVDGRVNLVSKKPLNIDEVVALISTVLKDEGYTAIRTGRTLKVVTLSEARSANLPVITANKPEDIVAGDDVITCIIPIRYANAIRLKEDITPLLSNYAVISSNEASNSLIITDTTANIQRLVKIVKSVDTQMSTVADVKVFLLEYADADTTAELINEVFEQRATSSSSGRNENQNQNPFMRMLGGGRGGRGGRDRSEQSGAGTGTSGAAQNVPVVAAADDRTNAVVVSGPADVLIVIGQVIEELDANPNEDHELFLYKLKYGKATNIKDRLNNLFQELENINQQNASNMGRGGGFNRGGGSSETDSVTDEVYIEADEDTNSLIIMTSTKNYEKIKGIIEKLDIPIPQVLIKALLAELTTTNALDIGVEWSVENLRSNGDSFLNELNYSQPLLEGFHSQIIAGDLEMTIRALQEAGNLNILSRPYILTSNNQPAVINVGQEFPFIQDTTRTDNDSLYNTVEYRKIGITLEVTPSINSDGLVIMDVKPEITNAAAETVTISEDFNATVFNSRSTESRVAIPHGSTIVIGGLMQDTETENERKIPLLGDLPIIGALFKRTQIDKQKTELLIFLTPQVASDIEELKLLSNHERTLSEFINNTSESEAESETLKSHFEKMESVYQETTGKADTEE